MTAFQFPSTVLLITIIASSLVSGSHLSSLGANLVYATIFLDQSIQEIQNEMQSAIKKSSANDYRDN